MFWHNFKYTFLVTLRSKEQVFWSLIFSLILGTLFYATFGNAYAFDELQKNIKVAVYIEDEKVQENFSNIVENISITEDGEKLLNVTYADSLQKAEELLREDDTKGLFYSEDGALKLTVKESGIAESILAMVVSNYHQIVTIMTDLSTSGPQVQMAAMKELLDTEMKNKEITLTNADMDVYSEYFFNLIAMSCLFSSFAGVGFVIKNQANLSVVGARKNITNTGGLMQLIAGLLAIWILLSLLSCIALGYLLILGVKFGDKIPMVILTIFVGNLVGLTSGFFIGSIGKVSEGTKQAIATAYSLVSCFLSGLMILDMKMIMHLYCPIVNQINPAARLSDTFYALKVYDNYDRFFENIGALLIMTVLFTAGGFLLGRRKQYASI